MSDNEATAFDPRALRVFSVLPDEDADEAYCVRHDRKMHSVDPIVHRQGGLYTTEERFSVYTCPLCLEETGGQTDVDPTKIYQVHLIKAFDKWDQGEAAGDWFRYLGAGTVEDLDDGRTFVDFDEVDDEGGDR